MTLKRALRAGWIRLTALLIFGLGSVLAYVCLAFTISGEPSDQLPNYGWVAVVQPATQPTGDEVALYVDASVPFVANTPMDYLVVVCGPVPYTGDLLIGRDARLSDVQAFSANGTPAPKSYQVLPNLQVKDVYANDFGNQGPVQVLHIRDPHPSGCDTNFGSPLDSPYRFNNGELEGITAGVSGQLAVPVPIQRAWAAPFGLWHGPQVIDAFPFAGAIPDLYIDSIGSPFAATKGLRGYWSLPAVESIDEVAMYDTFDWSVDSSRPADVSIDPLSWSSTNSEPIWPLARLTDANSLGALQNFLTFAAVFMGIGAALLASLMFEKLRPAPGSSDATERKRASPAAANREPAIESNQRKSKDSGAQIE